jgi:hypothetical protein
LTEVNFYDLMSSVILLSLYKGKSFQIYFIIIITDSMYTCSSGLGAFMKNSFKICAYYLRHICLSVRPPLQQLETR